MSAIETRLRRNLRFDSLEQVEAEVERLVTAERAGRLQRAGSWTLGQTLGHLAYWVNGAYEPMPLHVPWFVRMLLRMRKRAFLYGPMPAGVRIPRMAGGTLGTEVFPLEEGLARYRRALARLQSEAPTQPSPALGRLAPAEWVALTCRHAELHLSFMDAAAT